MPEPSWTRDLGKIGKTYARAGGIALAKLPAGLRTLGDALVDRRDMPVRRQVTWGIVSVICLLWLLGWALHL